MSLLTVSGVSKKENEIYTVTDITFSQQPLQNIAIAGETGSGKTTLLKMIGGFAQPDAGEIRFLDERVKGPFEKLLPGHPGIAYLSQHFELRNNYYVKEILEYANQLTDREAHTLYTVCRIEPLLNRRTDQLSGGEKQRIALAKLLIASPKLLLLDEPFSNLDAIHKTIIRSVISDLKDRLNISCIMVSHDAPDVLAWADTIIVMKDGVIIQQGSPEEIYFRPVNEYCAALFGEYNLSERRNNNEIVKIDSANQDKKLFLRPENILITDTDTAWKGTVKSVQFRGNYYMAEIEAGNQQLKIFTGTKTIKPGDIVCLALSNHVDWYI